MGKGFIKKQFLAFLLAGFVTINTHADDLDIYRSAGGIDANIMFVVDASGSMLLDLEGKDIVCGHDDNNVVANPLIPDLRNQTCFEKTRMFALQKAFGTVMDDLKGKLGVNVGLTWFGGPMGSGIKYPVTNINTRVSKSSGNSIDPSNPVDADTEIDVADVLKNMVNNLHSYKDYTAAHAVPTSLSSQKGRLTACTTKDNPDSNCEGIDDDYFDDGFFASNKPTKFDTLRADTAFMVTPTVDALYEVARYFRGEHILYGSRDYFAPWDSTALAYKLPVKDQTLHSLTEFWDRWEEMPVYAHMYIDLLPGPDGVLNSLDVPYNANNDDPYRVRTKGNHRSGPLLGWRAANPLAYRTPAGTPAGKTREYQKTTQSEWGGSSNYSAKPPVLYGYCGYNPSYGSDDVAGTGNDVADTLDNNSIMKSLRSWYTCNLKDDPSVNLPTNDEDWEDWDGWAPGNNMFYNHTADAGGGYQYDRTLAQFLIDLLITSVEANNEGSTVPCTDCNSSDAKYTQFEYKSIAQYNSPLGKCSKGAIVLITDGHPTANTVESQWYQDQDDGVYKSSEEGASRLGDPKYNLKLISTLTGESCDDIGNENGNAYEQNIYNYGRCGQELTEYLRTEKQHDQSLDGFGTVDTYTVAFGLTGAEATATNAYLGKLTDDPSKNTTATDTETLINEIDGIVTTILASTNDEVSAPTITLDNSSLKTANETYIPMFKPTSHPTWLGNIKGYDLNGGNVNLEQDSFWSTGDAGDIDLGGLNQWITTNGPNRKMYVTLNDNTIPAIPAGGLDLTGTTLDFDNLIAEANTNPGLTAATIIGAADGTSNDDVKELIEAFRAKPMSDSLHSKPVLVEYIDKKVLFAVTNRGLLHAFDVTHNDTSDTSGSELWGFMPFPAVKTINRQISDVLINSEDHIYTLDSQVQVWYHDPDNDGINAIQGDHVYLYFGMRRGGTYHYALDVTELDSPKLLWKIKAGDPGFEKLGQTWSPISLIQVEDGKDPDDGSGIERIVAVFGGGYRSNLQDDHNSTIRSGDTECPSGDSVLVAPEQVYATDCRAKDGLGIYMVDPKTGALLNSIGPDDTFETRVGADNMKYAIPSDLRTVDKDGDGFTDRLYFGDMGGQLWRINIAGRDNGIEYAGALAATQLADFGVDSSTDNAIVTSHRRFYYPPAVSLVSTGKYAVAIGSGHRASPLHGAESSAGLANLVQDNLYVVYDYDPAQLVNENITYPAYHNNLDNVTEVNVPATASAHGWRIELKMSSGGIGDGWEGEKSLSSPFIFDNKVLFLTFIPSPGIGECSLAGTQNLFYSLKLTTAASTIEIDPSDNSKDTNGNYIKPNKVKTAAVIPPVAKLVDSLDLITSTNNGGTNQECYTALAGTSPMAKFCKTPSKVYWKETK